MLFISAMKILITGASGRIGWDMSKEFIDDGHEVAGTYLINPKVAGGVTAVKIDLANAQQCIDAFKKYSPDVVVHAAALVNVEQCEKDHAKADVKNTLCAVNVLGACKDMGCKIILVSTASVFDGTKAVYYESDAPNPLNYYGISKLRAEEAVRASGMDHLILRAGHVYNWIQQWQNDNHFTRALKVLESGNVYEDVVDWYDNPTYAPDLASAVLGLVKKKKTGIYDLAGPDFMNGYEFSLKVADIFGMDRSLVKPIQSKKFNLTAKRPNVNLSSKKVVDEIGARFLGVEAALKDMKASRKQSAV